jgi:DNA-binding NarL/FixJ family response regulator
MFVEGLCLSINQLSNAEVTGTSHTLAQCRNVLLTQTPDVLLLDINLPDGNGIDLCTEIRQKYPEIKIIALSMHDEYSVVKQLIDLGAAGYILKNASSEEVIEGIEAVMNGETFLCKEIDLLMKKQIHQSIWLTAREREILKAIGNGDTNQEIADKLFLSIETIKTYRKNLILKLGSKNAVVLVKIAKEQNLI